MKEIKFGTEGWRGIIADDFNFKNVRIVIHAISNYLKSKNLQNNKVVIGYDNRFGGKTFSSIAYDIFSSNGFETKVSDSSITTPNICHAVKDEKAAAGIMITASHNPPKFNGIKVKAEYGGPVNEKTAGEIEKEVNTLLDKINIDELKYDRIEQVEVDFKSQYLSYLKGIIDFSLIKKIKKKIVVDYLHGSAGGYFEKLLYQNRLVIIRKKNDPLFGGCNPEPIEENLSILKKTVKQESACIGIALDGDGDRLGIVDEHGKYLPPHIVFPLILYYALKYKGLKGKVVQTISLGYISERIAKKYNMNFEELPVGFKYICEKMISENVIAGGEESGGYALKGKIPDRDGILSGLIFLEMLAFTGKKLSDIVKEVEKEYGKSFFHRYDLHLPEIIYDKKIFVDKIISYIPQKILNMVVKEVRSYDGIKIILEDDSWLLLRPSGTEPKLRIYSETQSYSRTIEMLEYGKKLIKNYFK